MQYRRVGLTSWEVSEIGYGMRACRMDRPQITSEVSSDGKRFHVALILELNSTDGIDKNGLNSKLIF